MKVTRKDKVWLGVVITLSLTGAYFYFSQPTVYIRPDTVEVEKQVEALEKRIETAKEARKEEVEEEAQEAYRELYELRMTEIENEVIDQYQVELDARKASNTEKVQAY